MNILNRILRIFFSPDDTPGTGTITPDSLPDLSDVDLLESETPESETETDTDEAETKDADEEAEETPDEEVEDEDTEDEPEEDSEKTVTPGRITVKGLKEQYPDIFKKNPGLKDVIFHEREYTKLFGNVEDAQEASAKANSFDNFEQTLMQGGIGELIDALADTNQESAVRVIENFLPEVYARSKPLFAKVTLPIFKGMIRNTFVRASNQGNKQLALACQYITRDLFETTDVMQATELEEQKPDPRLDEVNRQRNELFTQQISSARNDILNVVTSKLSRDISSHLKGNLSDFTREALTEKITDELDSTLFQDKAHMAHLQSLWKRMSRAGFASEAKSKIISASLRRAREVLPSVIAKVRAQQNGGKSSPKPKVQETKDRRFPNQPQTSKTRSGQPIKLDRNMSDYEFLSK